MIPYLLLPADRRSRVRKVLEEHAFDNDTIEAALTLLEELGTDRERICQALQTEEARGYMISGTFNDLIQVMGGATQTGVDWRDIPRRRM